MLPAAGPLNWPHLSAPCSYVGSEWQTKWQIKVSTKEDSIKKHSIFGGQYHLVQQREHLEADIYIHGQEFLYELSNLAVQCVASKQHHSM